MDSEAGHLWDRVAPCKTPAGGKNKNETTCQGVWAHTAQRSPWVEGRTASWACLRQGLNQEDQGSLQGSCPLELPEELIRDLFTGTEIKGRSLLTRNEVRTQLLELKT